MAQRLTLLTGGTGYVGGRLLAELEARGVPLRCLARKPEFLRPRVDPSTEVVQGNVLDSASLRTALEGVEVAYYLVHSMSSAGDFVKQDLRAARNFGREAREAGVRRIIYLGGLGSGADLSEHLRSRHQVGAALRGSGVPTVELRASIIIGSGSLSFEMIRALVEKLPIMITPRWVDVPAQPIAVEDAVDYLVAARLIPLDGSRVFEIGGADRVSYGKIMREYARQRGLRRRMVPVPVLTPYLSSLWLGLVTPVYARVGKKLIDGVRNPTVVQDRAALEAFEIRPRGIIEAIARALGNEDQEYARTRWADPVSSKAAAGSSAPARYGRRIVDSRSVLVPVNADAAFTPIRRIGGDAGWHCCGWLWSLRGFVDLLAGGVGMRRGRRSPDSVHTGDTIDFWRVERVEEGRLLRLQAEMKLPGRAWLQLEVTPDGPGSRLTQTAIFDPTGIGGLLYWYLLYPVHRLVFRGMLRGIARAAVAASAGRA